ncbi:MAG: hypothetical protein ACTSPI_14140 [Candidatus Heimdallarchaeaceae archaeon]
MVEILNPVLSMLITMSFFGIVFLLIFVGIRKVKRTLNDIKLRRKLAAAKLISEGKEVK